MASITGKKAIFFVTSPRTPVKMLEEIRLLIDISDGKKWNKETQTDFANALSRAEFFEGNIKDNLDFAARDRINRAPKSIGFVDLKPVVKLTNAGREFLETRRPHEIFTRQLLKFQLPSFNHVDGENTFNIKPYLELLRLIFELKSLSKDEIAIFVMQLTNIKKYNSVKRKIVNFRDDVKKLNRKKTSYKRFVRSVFIKEIKKQFKEEIKGGHVSTRESAESTISKFITTKINNHKDYADACIRYIRFTSLVTLNPKSYRIYIPEEKKTDVKYILDNIQRKTENFKTEEDFKRYLFNSNSPKLLNDDSTAIVKSILSLDSSSNEKDLLRLDIESLKNIKEAVLNERLSKTISLIKTKLENYEEYEDIKKIYDDIENKKAVEPSLIMEWNTWRAFLMLDDGTIIQNFRFDENGMPLHPAPGKMPDIICKYDEFDIIVEVTLSSGHKQFEMEGEPVARHLGNHKKDAQKETYCLFIAPSINESTLAYFYSLRRQYIEYYGGNAKIIPLKLEDFKCLLEKAYNAQQKPTAQHIKNFVERISASALTMNSENEWYQQISTCVETWV